MKSKTEVFVFIFDLKQIGPKFDMEEDLHVYCFSI